MNGKTDRRRVIGENITDDKAKFRAWRVWARVGRMVGEDTWQNWRLKISVHTTKVSSSNKE